MNAKNIQISYHFLFTFLIRKNSEHLIGSISSDKMHFKYFELSFSETHFAKEVRLIEKVLNEFLFTINAKRGDKACDFG